MKYFTTFFQKGDAFDIHGKPSPPPVECFTQLTLVLFVSLSEYDLYHTVVVFVTYLIYHFSYMLSMLETVFSLVSFKTISIIFSAACVPEF